MVMLTSGTATASRERSCGRPHALSERNACTRSPDNCSGQVLVEQEEEEQSARHDRSAERSRPLVTRVEEWASHKV
jgi:hypothetical protein